VTVVTLNWVTWLAIMHIRRRDSAATMSITYRLVVDCIITVT
jgi:hypothetical protein